MPLLPHFRTAVVFVLLLTSGVLASGLVSCVPPGTLQRADFEGRTLAVVAAPAPSPFVFHARLAQAGVAPFAEDGRPPEDYEETEVDRAERLGARLREALQDVAIADSVARRVGAITANTLGMAVVDDPDAADVLVDVRVLDYGLLTRSFTDGAKAFIDADIALLDPEAPDEPLWAFFPGEKRRQDFSGLRLFRLSDDALGEAVINHVDWVVSEYRQALRRDVR
ncbi:MAG: hypothetical protein GVY12_08455 [Bacteroidetes bacterium]|jgi:hypothetical protein|nr:hypothetical protein [Bacteroidota bacterium]